MEVSAPGAPAIPADWLYTQICNKGIANTADLIWANFLSSIKRNLPWLEPLRARPERLIVVGSGPSLAHTYERVGKDQEDGALVMAINSAAPWLREKGIVPNYHALIDPQPILAEFVMDAGDETIHLLASSVHPVVFDRLSNRKVVLWVADHGLGELGYMVVSRSKGIPLIVGGGMSMTNRAVSLGAAMGFRKFDFHGVDSSWNEKTHIDRDTPPNADAVLTVRCADREFKTTIQLFAQAREFIDLAKMWRSRGLRIRVFGDGLLPTLCRKEKP